MTKSDPRAAVSKFSVPPVVKTVVVRRRPEDAFRLFTEKLGAWWPLQQFSAAPNPSTCAFEGWVGGRVFQRAVDGVETEWGSVEAWEPPHRLVFSWTVGTKSADEAQRIEVIFTPTSEGTSVQLTHSGWEKLGACAEAMRNAFDNGWALIIEQCFARYADSPDPTPA
jgi:uncharacterized protein YndB with AHSA1/START domain